MVGAPVEETKDDGPNKQELDDGPDNQKLDDGPSKQELEEETKDTITELEQPKTKLKFSKFNLSLDVDESNKEYE